MPLPYSIPNNGLAVDGITDASAMKQSLLMLQCVDEDMECHSDPLTARIPF